MLQGPEQTVRRARSLRQDRSLPERLLWTQLKARPDGLKFRRQHPAGPYVADFYCHEARLVIEIDGEAHSRGDRPQRDALRDRWFRERDLRVLRLPAAFVLADLPAAITAILSHAHPPLQGEGDHRASDGGGVSSHADSMIPLRQPCGLPPPLAGEDHRSL